MLPFESVWDEKSAWRSEPAVMEMAAAIKTLSLSFIKCYFYRKKWGCLKPPEKKARVGIEPTIKLLQSLALPLGYRAEI